MIGTLNILTNPDKVLFDTGATTSFIFEEFYDKFGIRREMLENPMTIVTPGGNVIVRHIKQDQVISICGCTYFADLYVIPLKGIAVVLGMDCMTEHRAQINCVDKTISMKTPSGSRIVYQADKHSHIMAFLKNSVINSGLEGQP